MFVLQQQEVGEKVLERPRWWSHGLRERFKPPDVLLETSSLWVGSAWAAGPAACPCPEAPSPGTRRSQGPQEEAGS